MSKSMPILIAGAGIGGLATALSLANKGRGCIVLERAKELGEIGAGLQIGPNAFKAFDELGVGDRARQMAVFVDALQLMDALSGEELIRIPLAETFRTRFKNPYAVVHRGDLHAMLLNACRERPTIVIHTSSEVVRYETSAHGVVAFLQNGESIEGSGLVGADGLHSKVRRQLVGDGLPRVSGHSTYRSTVPLDEIPEDLRWNAATVWVGPKCHVVHFPISGWKTFNLVVTYHDDAQEPVSGVPVAREEVLRGFDSVCHTTRQIVERGKDWKKWVLCDRDPITNWSDGNVVLLGDAAHPTLQYMAQGACMAMEDAVCLGEEISRHKDDLTRAFAAYCQKRIHRTARIQIQSRLVGDHILHPSGGHAALRNVMLRSMTADDFHSRLEWLYGVADMSGGVGIVR